MRRVCLVGAGKVAHMHARALRDTAGTQLVAVCDPDLGRAQDVAAAYAIPHVFGSLEEAVERGKFEFAHVLVPPKRHADVAFALIERGVGVLIEKPMGLSAAECMRLVKAASHRGVPVGVNHNSLFYPAYLELRDALRRRSFGALVQLYVVVNRPLHWLRTESSWLHERPEHIAYESAVHPLAQIYDLAGPAAKVASLASRRNEVRGGLHFFQTWQASFECAHATAQLCLSYGEYPTFQVLAICDDGVLTADVEANRFTAVARTRWIRTRFATVLQPAHLARRAMASELVHGLRNMQRAMRREWVQRDVYMSSMQRSIAAFHHGPEPDQPHVDGQFGMHVVAMCDAMTGSADVGRKRARRNGRSGRLRRPDAVVLEGTGPLGTRLIEEMTSAGMTVRVLARRTVGLPPSYDRPGVEVVAGDVADSGSLSEALKDARTVVHLVDSRDRVSWETVEPALAKPAELLVQCSARNGVERLVCVGSITSLYLGDPNATVRDSAPIDLDASATSPFERGKARLEQVVLACADAAGLAAYVLRPGIVLGPGAHPLSPGLGVWRGDTHCVGWNAGTNPLPLVLVDDVAAAIRLVVASERMAQRAYNLVGDVRLSACECISAMRQGLERPMTFHPSHPAQHYALAAAKYAAAALLSRPSRPAPSYRAFKSRAAVSTVDSSQFKHELGWTPIADRDRFAERAFGSPRRS